jgi:hypothetical protein
VAASLPLDVPNLREVTQQVRADLSRMFCDLVRRADACHEQIKLYNAAALRMPAKFSIPLPEPLMVQAALSSEVDAGLEEMLGNLTL